MRCDIMCTAHVTMCTVLHPALRPQSCTICRQIVLDVAGVVPPEVIDSLLRACTGQSYQAVQQQVRASQLLRASSIHTQ